MLTKLFIIILRGLLIASCANYDEGYDDGYAGNERKTLILLGKTAYEDGYLDGEDDAWCDYLEETHNWQKYKEQCLQ